MVFFFVKVFFGVFFVGVVLCLMLWFYFILSFLKFLLIRIYVICVFVYGKSFIGCIYCGVCFIWMKNVSLLDNYGLEVCSWVFIFV